jgi:hypothetical protein
LCEKDTAQIIRPPEGGRYNCKSTAANTGREKAARLKAAATKAMVGHVGYVAATFRSADFVFHGGIQSSTSEMIFLQSSANEPENG